MFTAGEVLPKPPICSAIVTTLPKVPPIAALQKCAIRPHLTADVATHLSTVALQGRLIQCAAGHLGDEGDHVGADGGMFTAPCIAKADNLDPFFLLKQRVGPPIMGNIGAFGAKEFGRGLGTASGKEDEQQRHDLAHVRTMRPDWLRGC